jgi:hypothetical protein
MKKMKFGRMEEAVVTDVPPGAGPGSGSHVNLREATPSGGRNNARLFATTARAQSSSSPWESLGSSRYILVAVAAGVLGHASYLYLFKDGLEEAARKKAVSDEVS